MDNSTQNLPGRVNASAARALLLADTARDACRWQAAGDAYEIALMLAPGSAAIALQLGHARKEAGRYAAAWEAYALAAELAPEDPEVPLQQGHLMRVTGNAAAMTGLYRRAARLGSSVAAAEAERPAELLLKHAIGTGSLDPDLGQLLALLGAAEADFGDTAGLDRAAEALFLAGEREGARLLWSFGFLSQGFDPAARQRHRRRMTAYGLWGSLPAEDEDPPPPAWPAPPEPWPAAAQPVGTAPDEATAADLQSALDGLLAGLLGPAEPLTVALPALAALPEAPPAIAFPEASAPLAAALRRCLWNGLRWFALGHAALLAAPDALRAVLRQDPTGSAPALIVARATRRPVTARRTLLAEYLATEPGRPAAAVLAGLAALEALPVPLLQEAAGRTGAETARAILTMLLALPGTPPVAWHDLARAEAACGDFAAAVAALAQLPGDPLALAGIAELAPELEAPEAVLAAHGIDDPLRLLPDRLFYRLRTGVPPLPVPRCWQVQRLGQGLAEADFGPVPLCRAAAPLRLVVETRLPATALRIRLDGRTHARLLPGAPGFSPPEPLPSGGWRHRIHAFLEHAAPPPGPCELQVTLEAAAGELARLEVAVALAPSPAAGEPALAWLAAAPSAVHPAGRAALAGPFDRILAIRADQLGDLVISVPAIQALRRLFPAAHLTGLVAEASLPLAARLALFDAVEALAPGPAGMERLAGVLPRSGFDLAIDLSQSPATRPLLRLSGARHLVGFDPQRFPWLGLGLSLAVPDAAGAEQLAQPAQILALVEALARAVAPPPLAAPLPPPDATPLTVLGLAPRHFVMLHAGARIAARRWPAALFGQVAGLLAADPGLPLLAVADAMEDADALRAHGPPGLVVLVAPLPFPLLEALLGHAALVVANDSGPKHLAALRGTPVVSLHSGAAPAAEWGQVGRGLVLMRDYPCVPCNLMSAADCALGRPCLTGITPEEAAAAARRLLAG